MSVNLSTPTGKPKRRDRRDLAELHKALDDAAFVLKLSAVSVLHARDLINRIPKDAPTPVSPASVQSLAEESGKSPRAIYGRNRGLEKAGIVRNECLDGGARTVQRDRSGKIIAIAGISFAPLLDNADYWAEQAAAIRFEIQEAQRLRKEISKTKRRIRSVISSVASQRLRNWWDGLERRTAHLSRHALESLLKNALSLMAALDRVRQQRADRSEESFRPYTTQQDSSKACNRPRSEENAANERSAERPTCGLEHINLRRAMMIAPPDWQVAINQHGAPSWHALVGVAYARAQALGISPTAWAMAQAALGQQGAAIIVLLADAKSIERGGTIRSVGGWVRRMAERAENGTANLHRTVFGLLNEESTP